MARALGLTAVLALVLGGGACDRRPAPAAVPVEVGGWPRERVVAPATSDPAPLFEPLALDLAPGSPHLVAVRLEVGSGAVDCVVSRAGAELARRRVARLGDDLVVLPVRALDGPGATFAVRQAKGTGPLDVAIRSVTLYSVTADTAASTAAGLADAFERETGRAGDPAVENLVANADFAADDEVRGTPEDWFAYVDTRFDATAHSLEVAGTPPPGRPLVATGPVPVEAGRRYRAVARVAVSRGGVVFRAVDFDELETVAATEAILPAPDGSERSLEFTVPPGCRAIRLRFDAAASGEPTELDLSTVQMEALPQAAPEAKAP